MLCSCFCRTWRETKAECILTRIRPRDCRSLTATDCRHEESRRVYRADQRATKAVWFFKKRLTKKLPTRPPLHALLAPCLLKSQARFFCSSRCLPRCPGVAPDCSVSHLVRVPTGTKHDAALSPPPSLHQGSADARSEVLSPHHHGIVQLWRLRRVCKELREWGTLALKTGLFCAECKIEPSSPSAMPVDRRCTLSDSSPATTVGRHRLPRFQGALCWRLPER